MVVDTANCRSVYDRQKRTCRATLANVGPGAVSKMRALTNDAFWISVKKTNYFDSINKGVTQFWMRGKSSLAGQAKKFDPKLKPICGVHENE